MSASVIGRVCHRTIRRARWSTASPFLRGRHLLGLVSEEQLHQPLPSAGTCHCCSSFSASSFFRKFATSTSNNDPHLLENQSRTSHPPSGQHRVSSVLEVGEWVYALNQKAITLEPLSFLGVDSLSPHETASRQQVFQETNELVAALVTAVEKGQIDPSGKYGRELSALLVHILRLYSVSVSTLPPPAAAEDDNHRPSSVFQKCSELLKLMKTWNLDCHSQHSHYSILAAAHEGLWKEASDLFLQQVDPDFAGYTPIDVSVSSPVGLYSIARHAHEQGRAGVVEQVFEAVLNMSLVSPQDQHKYVLAAGTALGLAGEWEALVSYLENSYNSSQLGQALVAAAMHSCILCNRHDQALQLFRKLVDGNLLASEFHWGGGEHRTAPVCRDLAMRAMGRLGGASEEALQLFRQAQDDGFTISVEGLWGVMRACEQDQNWHASVDVLFTILDNATEPRWAVHGDALDIVQIDSNPKTDISPIFNSPKLAGQLLSSVMRACNAAGEFGIGLLCLRLFEIAMPDSVLSAQQEWLEVSRENGFGSFGPLELSFAPLIASFGNDDEFVAATMVALSGFGCHHHAAAIYELLSALPKNGGSLPKEAPSDADNIYRHACANLHADNEKHRCIAEAAHRHVYRLTRALHAIKSRREEVSPNRAKLIVSALSATIRACTMAQQPEAGIVVAKRLNLELSRLRNSAQGSGSIFAHNDDVGVITEIMAVSDSHLAHTMLAYSASGRSDAAMELFESVVNGNNEVFAHWTLSCNAAIKILADNKSMDGALDIFRKLADSSRNPNSFSVVAHMLAADGRWAAVTDVYNLALERSSLSEEVGILAMKAVAETSIQDRLVALRGIVEKTATLSGLDSSTWLENHYWMLKSSLGFTLARLLLWWDDPNTCHLDELELAIKNFEQRKSAGLKAKHDVVRVIVSHAGAFNEVDVRRDSSERKELVRIPLSKGDWVKMLVLVVEEAQSLRGDTKFVDSVAEAFINLGCYKECVQFVQDATCQGYVVGRIALQRACLAAESAELNIEANNLRLLMIETHA